MESLEESTSNQVEDKSDENKNKDNSLKENGVPEPLPKKKFANTNFALKMKNKKREEKLNNIDTKEAFSSCKQVSIDVTRLTSNPVPKLINAVENKTRRRKKWSQWKMGITKKKKKPLSKGPVNGVVESNHVSENIQTAESLDVKKEEPIQPSSSKKKQTNAADSDSSQRRKSLRSVTSIMPDANVCEPENTVNMELVEESFSCRRTEPFVGKLVTKEARNEIANRILKGETEPKVVSNNETSVKEVPSGSKESETEDVNKLLPESNESAETNDKVDKKATRSTRQTTVMETNEKVVTQPARRSTSRITEAKESVKIEESSCSRTMPFVGKTLRKLAAGVPEIPVELDSSTNQSDEKSVSKDDTNNLDSMPADQNELFDSPKDINANADSTLGIKILSVSSLKDDESMKADFLPEKVDEPASQPPIIPLKDATIDSDSSNKINMDSDASANKIKAKSKLSKSRKLDTPTKSLEEHADSFSEKTDTPRETRRSAGSVMRRTSLRSNISVKSDSLSEDIDSKSTISSLEDPQDSGICQRVIPFQGKSKRSRDKQLATENAPNQVEAPSPAPKISSVLSDDPAPPPEPIADRLVPEKVNELHEDKSQNEIGKDVASKDVDKVESAVEPSNNLDARSSTDSPVLNGEWKFRRKRQILSSDDESQDKEPQKNKKYKVQSSSDIKTPNHKKTVTPLPSPEKPICSFLSTKCTKHDHHPQSDPCPAPNDVKPEAYVSLTRLEDMADPEVKGFFAKTGLVNTIKKNYRRIMTDKVTSDTSKVKSHRERSVSTSTQATKDDVAPSNVPETAHENDSNASFRPGQDNEDTSNQYTATSASTSRRRASSRASRASTESPILQTKRRKRLVNYIEDFSDSDEGNKSSSRKLRSQSRGPSLRSCAKTGAENNLEAEDENDMEVEEFSRVGRHNRAVDSNQEDSEQESSQAQPVKQANVFKKARGRGRCKSVAERKISHTSKYPTRSKTPHIGASAEQNGRVVIASEIDKKKLEQDLLQGLKSMEETINKEMEKIGLIPPGTSSISAGTTTPTLSRQVSSERLSSTPSIPASKSVTPKKILATPSQNDVASPQSGAPTTPRRSVSFQKNELLAKVTKSASELLAADRKQELKIKDIRVQLIKLEAVCSDYKDYSAGEIELLTTKYIDMLMNSNFACDTWRVSPIKLATSYSRPVDLGADEGDSDVESQDNEPLPFETVQVPMDSAEVDYEIAAEQSTVNESPRRRTPKKSNKQPSEFEAAIASLSQKSNSPERTFGAIDIAVVLSQPAADEEDAENNKTVDSTAEDEHDDSVGPAKDAAEAILVNGTEVHACASCNKIFMEKELLQRHLDKEHGANEKSSASTSVPSKSSDKPVRDAPGPASSKKSKGSKFKYNDSLKCSICSEMFTTKELLFDHIMTHNEQDLQQAYKAAKLAKQQQTGETDAEAEEQAKSKKQKKKPSHRKSTDSSSTAVSGEELTVDDPARPTTSQQAEVLVTGQSLAVTCSNKALSVCQCHAHELGTQDLHIEMVLLCTACNVIFRRRDCFETHFRTSAECRRKRANGEATKVPKLFCSGCRCVLSSLVEMRTHLEEHASKNCAGTVSFLCNICKVAFFGVGGIFYSHWFNHTKSPNFVASRYSFPKLSVVSILEDVNGTMTTSKSQEGFFYIAEHVCRDCRLPFSSDPELQKHKQYPCQSTQPVAPRVEPPDNSRLQMIKLICDLCKKYYVSKDNFDKHCNDRNHLKTPITKFSRLPINANEQVFVCSLCRGLSKTLDLMKEHWKRVHSPIMELYTCKTCNVVPSNDVANYTYEKFESHCRLVHKSEVITCLVYFVTARYVCGICKFGFETEKSMKEHELVHQKKTAVQSATVQNATPAAVPLAAPQTATFYLADNPQADGGRRLHPVVLQYPGINGTIAGPMTMTQLPTQPQLQLQLPSQMPNQTMTPNQIVLPNPNLLRAPNVTATNTDNSELRSLLATALQGQPVHQQQQQQQITTHPQEKPQSNPEKIVETIDLDSRSNSPVLDSPAAGSSSSSNSLAAAKKSYMTRVNPDFETILKTTGNQENRNSANTPSADRSSNREDNATPAEVDTLTPQPFEVVLVTDELSENSDQDKNDNLGSTSADEQQQQQQQQQAPEIIETKSFLRVRSVAELQSIKIHLCSICGLSFDTPQAFEQHEKQHRAMGEVGRSTPVQMISPMVAPASKETTNEPHSVLVSQMKQKMNLAMANGPSVPAPGANANTRVMPNVLPHQPVLPPQQQQSWYPTPSNNAPSATMSNNNRHYGTSQQLPPPLPPQQQQHSVLRQPMNTAPTRTGYTTVRPPPPYPGTSNSMVASGRPSAIQLPERSTTGNIPPQPKRPSGAATRIPQQSLQSFDDINNRQTGGTVTYNPPPQQQSVIHKTYGPAPSTVNYSTVNGPVNYQSVPQPQPRQQQPQKNIIYTCKHPSCCYRSASLAGIRAHETVHLVNQQGQQSQQMPTTSNNHQQQQQQQQMQIQMQQQQQQPPRLLPVSQMPERTRHALPTSRPPGVSNNPEKRITCRICNLNCATSIELIEHVSTVHSGANQVCCYVCDYCPSPLIFDTEDQLRKHMNVSHNHSCELCNKRYPSKEDLMLHVEVHMRRT